MLWRKRHFFVALFAYHFCNIADLWDLFPSLTQWDDHNRKVFFFIDTRQRSAIFYTFSIFFLNQILCNSKGKYSTPQYQYNQVASSSIGSQAPIFNSIFEPMTMKIALHCMHKVHKHTHSLSHTHRQTQTISIQINVSCFTKYYTH